MKKLLLPALALCLFLLIVGAKWATFDRFGSAMPDWDQWDAEAVELFIPWFQSDNFLSHLFHPHNEHRVILTKLQNLALGLLNGQWDSRLEAVTNALLHTALAVAFWLCGRGWLLEASATRGYAAGTVDGKRVFLTGFLFVLAVALFGLPLAWQNVLGGFHSQQYWLLGLSFAAIVTLPFVRTWSAAWWLGALSAVLALGSMGSGFLAAAVVLGLVVWRIARGQTAWHEVWPTLLLTLALVAVGLLTRVEVAWHANLKAKTVHDFVFSILRSLAWPLRDRDWVGAILWLPWALIVWRVLRGSAADSKRQSSSLDRPTAVPFGSLQALVTNTRSEQTIAALGGWVFVQIVATAYARGAGADYPASRYMDTLAFGAMVNGVALAWLLTRAGGGWGAVGVRYGLGLAWLVTLGLGVRDVTERNLRYELVDAKKYYVKAEANMRRYLATNDPKQLASPDIPFPSADGLIERLANKHLRALMPVPIRAPLAVAPAAANSAFVVNEARVIDSALSPPRHGLSPATPPLEVATTFGSFTGAGFATTGIWKSAPITPSQLGWLKFETAGHVGPGNSDGVVSLALHDAESGSVLAFVRPSKRAGDSWRSAYVRTPMKPFVIVASDQSSSEWLAFSAPVEMGTLSYWAWQAAKHGLLLVYGSAIAAAALAVVAWFRGDARSAA